ncbi:membrane protein containing DUF1294 [gut metagenome]|uniref:Membrane protein containing DUF1294 n=1 Tax=gut metagenome TaxID=749906 RepID=J9G7N5_9ZZZZ
MEWHSIVLYFFISVNLFTFVLYGWDKRKAQHSQWRIPESTLLALAFIGGGLGAWCGMKVWHHKTQHFKFKYGVPVMFFLQLAVMAYFHV